MTLKYGETLRVCCDEKVKFVLENLPVENVYFLKKTRIKSLFILLNHSVLTLVLNILLA